MKPTKSKALCRGCGSDFYNHGGQGAKECRSYAEAQVVKRYRLYWWAQPTRPGAFVRMWVMSCLHETGS
ncbi:MAG: hypothetical protein GY719_34925, partial [bacterium]|nr:hypothetical protein [bacterium]